MPIRFLLGCDLEHSYRIEQYIYTTFYHYIHLSGPTRHLVSLKLITTSCLTTELLFPCMTIALVCPCLSAYALNLCMSVKQLSIAPCIPQHAGNHCFLKIVHFLIVVVCVCVCVCVCVTAHQH